MQINLLASIIIATGLHFVRAFEFDVSIQHSDVQLHLRDDTKALLPEVNTRITCVLDLLTKATGDDATAKAKIAMAFGKAADPRDYAIIKRNFEALKAMHVPIWKDNDHTHAALGFGETILSTDIAEEWKQPHYAGKTIPKAVVVYTSAMHEETTPVEQKLRTVIHEASHVVDMDLMTDRYLEDTDGSCKPATYEDIEAAEGTDKVVLDVYYHAQDHYDAFLEDVEFGYHMLLLGSPDAYALLAYVCKHGKVPTNREMWDV